MTQRTGSGSGAFDATGAAPSAQERVGETVHQVSDQAKEKVGQVAGQAREQVSTRLSGQKDRAAEGLTGMAQALRQTGQQLRDQDQTGMTDYIDSAAAQVERVSDYLRSKDVGDLVDDVEQFARRQPALFVGGAFVLGVLGVRFLKSSRQKAMGTGQYPLATQSYPALGGAYGQDYQRTAGTSGGYSSSAYGAAGTSGYGTGTGTAGSSTGIGTGSSRTTEEL